MGLVFGRRVLGRPEVRSGAVIVCEVAWVRIRRKAGSSLFLAAGSRGDRAGESFARLLPVARMAVTPVLWKPHNDEASCRGVVAAVRAGRSAPGLGRVGASGKLRAPRPVEGPRPSAAGRPSLSTDNGLYVAYAPLCCLGAPATPRGITLPTGLGASCKAAGSQASSE
jgi:hypothetical protein